MTEEHLIAVLRIVTSEPGPILKARELRILTGPQIEKFAHPGYSRLREPIPTLECKFPDGNHYLLPPSRRRGLAY